MVKGDEVKYSLVDALDGTGDQAGMCFWKRIPLVCIHPKAIHPGVIGGFEDGSLDGETPGTKDHICTSSNAFRSHCGPPFGIGEGDIQAARVVGGDHADIRVGISGSTGVTFGKGDHRRHNVAAIHAGHYPAAAQAGSQGARQESGMILVKDQTGQVLDGFILELIDRDEVNLRIAVSCLQGGIRLHISHRDDDIIACFSKGGDVCSEILNVARFDVIDDGAKLALNS